MDAPSWNGPDDRDEPRPDSLYVVCDGCDTVGYYPTLDDALDDGWILSESSPSRIGRRYCSECQTHGGPIRRTP